MNWLGIYLEMLIGRDRPSKAPLELNEALKSAEVTYSDQGQSGFQLTFQMGRRFFDTRDYPMLRDNMSDSPLRPFNRVILLVYFNLTRHVLMDGIITNHQFSPGNDPGGSTLTVTGEDLSVMMSLNEVDDSSPRQHERRSNRQIVQDILNKPCYSSLGFEFSNQGEGGIADSAADSSPSQDVNPTQILGMTDLAYIRYLAVQHGYVFYIQPRERPSPPDQFANIVYWGPPNRRDASQPPLYVNMGPSTNVQSISFQYNALAPYRVQTQMDEQPIQSREETRQSLSREVAEIMRVVYQPVAPGLSEDEARTRAQARAQALVNRSSDDVVTATGELDSLRYGELLKPHCTVDLGGVGESYDGEYYVKSVTHRLDPRKGEYKQSFTLSREGLGATSLMARLPSSG